MDHILRSLVLAAVPLAVACLILHDGSHPEEKNVFLEHVKTVVSEIKKVQREEVIGKVSLFSPSS